MHGNSISVLIRRTVIFIVLVFSTLAPASPATAQVTGPLPVLSSLASSGTSAILVRGEGFTTGGEVFIAVRFILRMDVRVSLVKNPRTPTDLSLAVLRTIPRGHVEEVATLADVPLAVRDLARRIIARQPLH